jgi:hypothetical protein
MSLIRYPPLHRDMTSSSVCDSDSDTNDINLSVRRFLKFDDFAVSTC